MLSTTDSIPHQESSGYCKCTLSIKVIIYDIRKSLQINSTLIFLKHGLLTTSKSVYSGCYI